MQNLKWKNIIAVFAVVVVFGLIAAYKLGYIGGDSATQVGPTSTYNGSFDSTTSAPVGNTTIQNAQAIDNSSAIGFQSPPEPSNGKVRSVTMVGPSGVYNSLVRTNGSNYKLIRKGFKPMLINEEAVSPQDIKTAIQEFINDSWNNGVSSKGDVQLVVASSLTGNPKIKSITEELRKTYNVTMTTSDTEGAGAFRVAVAPQYYNTAFVMDITPTITRFTYSINGSSTRTIVAKSGSKYYQNNQTREQALAEIRSVVNQIPQSNRQYCIVLWAAAEKELRQGSNRYSALPNYNGSERFVTSGIELINEVKVTSNANVIFDFESMWFSSF